MCNDRSVFNAVLRHDLVSFIGKAFAMVGGGNPYKHNWHIEVMADYLIRAYNRDIKRLIITLPPRNLKSICASVAFPAWALGQDPSFRFIGASYSADLAGKHARDCRKVMEAGWYKQTFPKTRLNHRKLAEEEFETTTGGFRLSTSVGGTLTGRGGNFIIIDDPIKPQDALSDIKRNSANQWFDNTLVSRLDDKQNDVIIIVSQRVHVDDLVGHVLVQEGWTHLNLPAIAEGPERFELPDGRIFQREPGEVLHPDREPLEVLERIRAEMGSFYFDAQYLQAPVPASGNMIKWDCFNFYDEVPRRGVAGDRYVVSWDTAMSEHDGSDFSVGTVWAIRGPDYYLVDVIRKRLKFPNLMQLIIKTQAELGARDVLIEDAGIGTAMIQYLRDKASLRPIAIKPKGSKADRMAAQSAVIEAGRVYLPKKAPWLDVFKTEILGFPHSMNDDQVDSVSQLLKWHTDQCRRTCRVRTILW